MQRYKKEYINMQTVQEKLLPVVKEKLKCANNGESFFTY